MYRCYALAFPTIMVYPACLLLSCTVGVPPGLYRAPSNLGASNPSNSINNSSRDVPPILKPHQQDPAPSARGAPGPRLSGREGFPPCVRMVFLLLSPPTCLHTCL
jgi:hypothetical protein